MTPLGIIESSDPPNCALFGPGKASILVVEDKAYMDSETVHLKPNPETQTGYPFRQPVCI